jgi:hypothetical protein
VWEYAEFRIGLIQLAMRRAFGVDTVDDWVREIQDQAAYHAGQQEMVERNRKTFWHPILGIALSMAVNEVGLVGKEPGHLPPDHNCTGRR